MKKLLTLAIILLPFFAKSQSTSDADFCISRVESSPLTAASGQTYRRLHINASGTGKVGINIPANSHDIHIVSCMIENAQNGNGGIFVGAGCYNITIDSNFIATSYRGVYLNKAGKTDGSLVNIHVNNNRFLNIADATGHPNGGGSSIQFNNVNGGGLQMNYNKTLTTIISAEVGDVYNYYQTNGTSSSWAQCIGNQIQGGSTLTDGKSGFILGDVGGSYQIGTDNIMVNSGAQGGQIQGGNNIVMRRNKAYGAKTSYTYEGFAYGNYSGSPSTNVTIDSNRANWTNKGGSRLDFWFDNSTVTKPIGWDSNVSDNTLSTSLLPTPLFSTCSVIVSPPVIAYSPNSNSYIVGAVIASKTPSNTGGAASSYSITPTLSAGLSFNTSTGVISGTPTATNMGTTYTITATNSGGPGSTTIGITVTASLAVPSFTYSPSSNVYTAGTAIANKTPISSGGAITSYSITPSLPSGLSFNTSTGVISGTPAGMSANTTYTITGVNASGSGTATINIQVNAASISAPVVSYTSSTNVYTYGTTIASLYPQNTGGAVVSWNISPALPSGITFVNGLISGTPTVIHSYTTYTITATNTGGTSTTHVYITINPANLLITADSKQRRQGVANPTLTVTYSGFKLSDNQSNITQPTVSTTALTGSPNGTYPISATGAVSSNYIFTYINGILIVGDGFSVGGRFGGIIRLSR